MKFKFSKSAEAEAHVFIVNDDRKTPASAKALDEASGGLIETAIGSERFNGKPGEVLSVILPKAAGAKRALLFGGGKAKKRDERAYENIGGAVAKQLLTSGLKTVAVHVDDGGADAAARIALGINLGAYRFDTYVTKGSDNDKPTLNTATLVLEDATAAKAAWSALEAASAGTYLARDLMNEPPNVLYPESYAAKIKEELEPLGVKVTVLGEKELGKLGMRAMLGVGQGSVRDSQLVVMEWNGGEGDKVAFVGKGVCFDTGGISLKPGPKMEDMKGDMGGSAAVVGAMKALAMRKAKANVVGLVGLVENMPDGNAQRPGDIVKAADGQTIEIQNTDAEGRLVLCDVLWYAQEHHKPKAIVDLATLTGAIVVSLGHEHAGLFSNDDKLASQLSKAGEAEGETVWRMPLGDNYDKLLKSKFADMRNIGGPAGGSITAAQFLKRFIRDGQAWAHLDIAGVAWREGDKSPIDPSWASGFGPRLLDRFVKDNFEG